MQKLHSTATAVVIDLCTLPNELLRNSVQFNTRLKSNTWNSREEP
jgi:hypothetical protein